MTHPSRPGTYSPGPTAAAPGSALRASTPRSGPAHEGFGETRFQGSSQPVVATPAAAAGPGPAAPGPAMPNPAMPSPAPPNAGRYAPAQSTGTIPPPAPVAPALPGTTGADAGTGGATPRPTKAARVRGPRRARLQLRHVSPFTVLKLSAVLAVALFFVWLMTIGILYEALNGAGVIKDINDSVNKINGNVPITAIRVFAGATIIGLVNIVLFIALATLGSVIYNLCADLVGGVEITLSERDS